jgi:Domain of unknown function (DUF1877)
MAMIGNLRPATDAELDQLLANPREITRFLYGSDASVCERVVLNKAWHAIHFVLTGSRLGGSEPLNFLLAEATPVGDVDVGYGPARAFTRVNRFARSPLRCTQSNQTKWRAESTSSNSTTMASRP